MNPLSNKLSSAFVVTLMVAAGFLALAPAVAGEARHYELGELEIITGSVGDFPGAGEKLTENGDFIAIRFGNDTWFSVVYGTENEPNYIHMRSHQKRYLGGATVENEKGRTVQEARSIPVVRHVGQALTTLVEFKDDGYRIGFGQNKKTIGAENDLFDYLPRIGYTGHSTFQENKHEPVQKVVSLNTAWELTDKQVNIDREAQTADISFSLTATNLSYIYIDEEAPDELPVLEEVTLTFNLQAQAVQKDVDVPWYRVTVKRSEVTSSRSDGTRHYNGTAIDTSMKYDHLIDGWDFTERDNRSKIMLLTFTTFATFIPNGVADWMKAQFFDEHLSDGTGMVEYETDYEIDQETGEHRDYQDDPGRAGDEGNDGKDNGKPDDNGKVKYRPDEEYLNKVQRIKKNRISFNDNWDRAARFTWISDVETTIDGNTTNETLTYQIHAMQPLQLYLAKVDLVKKTDRVEEYRSRGIAKGIVMMGGYIYPAGDTLFHDPGFEAATTLVNIIETAGAALQNLLDSLAAVQLLQVALVAIVAIGAVNLTHKRLKR